MIWQKYPSSSSGSAVFVDVLWVLSQIKLSSDPSSLLEIPHVKSNFFYGFGGFVHHLAIVGTCHINVQNIYLGTFCSSGENGYLGALAQETMVLCSILQLGQ